eukprot:m.395295 g.395295  ORF g.395295 m.395295 type:complete len:131 (-) comp21099_c0_seq28:1096-1488(-)
MWSTASFSPFGVVCQSWDSLGCVTCALSESEAAAAQQLRHEQEVERQRKVAEAEAEQQALEQAKAEERQRAAAAEAERNAAMMAQRQEEREKAKREREAMAGHMDLHEQSEVMESMLQSDDDLDAMMEGM